VILVDANLLVYAHVSSFREHEGAREWLDAKLAGPAPVGMPWESLLAFTRLVSNPRVFARPLTVAEAWKQATSWLSCPATWIPQPAERHGDVLGQLLRTPGLRASHVPDAHLAALAIEHGLVLCSTDGDFARFQGLRWEDPLRS
jgi:toxin-antitoxin system PIN domain toxin